MTLAQLDTSFWLTKDKAWVAERKAKWQDIEPGIALRRNKGETNMAKAYYLRGKQPNWEKLKASDKSPRPLDLMMFLWLHPSDDPEVLTPLFKAYMESDQVHELDILIGLRFMSTEFIRHTWNTKPLHEYQFPYLGNKNVTLFRIMFADPLYVKNRLQQVIAAGRADVRERKLAEANQDIFGMLGYEHFLFFSNWLLQDLTSIFCRDCLYQYLDVLDWCMTTLNYDTDFIARIQHPSALASYHKALYRIVHFDLEQEGDTPRANAVRYLRELIEQGDFLPEFKQIWQQVKAGEVEVEKPWQRF
ncbi:hypothetical protein Q4519_00225 [Motilimonas sp. 1_MG-2023]|uniref:hypothetical protein n=1 Tax=Motilimonas sp. 1_MG-2023 TaxID=3062672 RepID=UPI0026E1ABA0|nr:hypothetical protein [Motilimonas sp. 1_MG-2023]MDO6524094.1 hypothetical protein [Motilimonas sp. 1_MG-2023]